MCSFAVPFTTRAALDVLTDGGALTRDSLH
jgi:hypothetical protein